MAFIQYLVFDGENLPLPTSYDVAMDDVEADSSGETEAGTTQRDVVRSGVHTISVDFSVTPRWLKKLTVYKQKTKISVRFFDTETLEQKLRCISRDIRQSWKRTPPTKDCGRYPLR